MTSLYCWGKCGFYWVFCLCTCRKESTNLKFFMSCLVRTSHSPCFTQMNASITHGTAYLAIFYLQAWCIFVKYENCHITLSVLGQIFWLNCNGRSFDEIMKMLGSNKLCGQVYRNNHACQDLFLRTCSKSLVKKEPEVTCLKGAHRYVWHLDPCAQ